MSHETTPAVLGLSDQSGPLPQQSVGQGSTMLICGGPDVDPVECGHWYSPDHVRWRIENAVAAERERCAVVRRHFWRIDMQRQTTPYSLTQYIDAGCLTLARDGKLDLIGMGIHGATGGMPCNGCHMLKTGCKSFDKLRGDAVARQKAAHPGATVREEAARRGISIGEVRRQRQRLWCPPND